MVHQYKNNGYNIVLDVNSGAIHVVDDVTYDVIELFEDNSAKEIIEKLVEAQITEQVEAVQEAAVQAVQVHQTQLNQQLLVYQLIKMMGKNNNYGGTFA